jgi:zinc protease
MARDLPLVLDVLADELRRPRSPPASSPRRRPSSRTTCCAPTTDTSARAQERLAQLAFAPGHPYHPLGRAGKLQSLAALGVDELRDFHRARYVGDGTILAIVGDVDARAVIAQETQLFGDMAKGEKACVRTPSRAPARRIARRAKRSRCAAKANMNIVIGGASGPASPRPRLRGSARLQRGVRPERARVARRPPRARQPKGLSYEVSSRYALTDLLDGVWRVNVNVAPQNTAKALRSTLDEIASTPARAQPMPRWRCRRISSPATTRSTSAPTPASPRRSSTPRSSASARATSTSFRRASAPSRPPQANAALRKHFAPDKLHVIVAGDLDSVPD